MSYESLSAGRSLRGDTLFVGDPTAEDLAEWKHALTYDWRVVQGVAGAYAGLKFGILDFKRWREGGVLVGKFYDERSKKLTIKTLSEGVISWFLKNVCSSSATLDPRVKTACAVAEGIESTGGSGSGALTYPPGTITAFDALAKVWMIAVPKGAQALQGVGLGEVPVGSFDVMAPQAVKPGPAANITEVTVDEFKKATTPWYKKWYWWVGIGVVATSAVGAVIVMKKGI